jgi:hypothetical protein
MSDKGECSMFFNVSRHPTLLRLQREKDLSFAALTSSLIMHLLCVGLSRVRGSHFFGRQHVLVNVILSRTPSTRLSR